MKKERLGVSSNGLTNHPVTQKFLVWMSRPVLLAGLVLSIPAFYLLLGRDSNDVRLFGHALYGLSGLIIGADTSWQWFVHRDQVRRSGKLFLDIAIAVGCVASTFPSGSHWGVIEWLLRLSLCALVFLRISMLVLLNMKPSRLVQMLLLALLMLSSAGGVFYWLEPDVHNYADGVWLAFTTVATVGYGDFVPSTPASKIFAVFIVLFGYAMFSIVTANIAALFVGEDEARIAQEMHDDIRALHREIAALRDTLRLHDIELADRVNGTRAKDRF